MPNKILIKVIDGYLINQLSQIQKTLIWELNFYISGYQYYEMVLVSNIYTMAL